MRRCALLGLAALLFLIAGCDSERRAISRDDLPDVSTTPAVVVHLGDDGFDRDHIDVTTADLVQFVNTGTGEHGVRTADSGIDTGPLQPGESTVVLFDAAATYELTDVNDAGHSMTVVAAASATHPG